MTVVALVLAGAGIAVIVAAALAALRPRDVLTRLHYLAPATSLGGPLVGAGLAVANGWSPTTATVLLVVVLLAATGPVLGAATGRVAANDGRGNGE